MFWSTPPEWCFGVLLRSDVKLLLRSETQTLISIWNSKLAQVTYLVCFFSHRDLQDWLLKVILVRGLCPRAPRGKAAPLQPPRRPIQQVDPRNDCFGLQIVKEIIRLHNLTKLTLDSLDFSFFFPTQAWNKNEPVCCIWVFTLASFSLW